MKLNGKYIRKDMWDGDWLDCPKCEKKSCILIYHNYCPICGEELFWEYD